MNLLIPSLALALVAIVLVIAIGKVLGGHSAASNEGVDERGPGPEPIRPPAPAAPLAPPAPSPPAALERGLQDELQELLAAGQVIRAIKRYREVFGVGLREAKEAIDGLRAQRPLPPQPQPSAAPASDPAQDPELRAALASGKKILAIKRYRELTGLGLKDSKDAVERM